MHEQEIHVEREDFNVNNCSFSSPLDLIFQDEDLKLHWEDFVQKNEEEQALMLLASTSNKNNSAFLQHRSMMNGFDSSSGLFYHQTQIFKFLFCLIFLKKFSSLLAFGGQKNPKDSH